MPSSCPRARRGIRTECRRRLSTRVETLPTALAGLLALTACGGSGSAPPPPVDANPPQLRFTSFDIDLTVVQAGSVTVTWVANDADDDATVSILADVDGDLETTADTITLVNEAPERDGQPQELSVDLSEINAGSYAVIGRIRDGRGGEQTVVAPGRLVVENRSLLAPIADGDLELHDHAQREDGSFDMLGRFRGIVNLDARNRMSSTSRTWDMFIAHYSRLGVIQWLQVFESTGDLEGRRLIRMPNGDLLVAGAFGGTMTLPGGGSTRGQGFDVFLTRLDPDTGAPRWVRTAASPNRDIGHDLAVLSDGSFVLTGTFNIGNTTFGIDFGPGPDGIPVMLTSNGIGDGFVTRFDGDGVPQWARGVGSRGPDEALSVCVVEGDRIVVGGAFEGTARFGTGGTERTAAGAADGFLATWDDSGSLLGVDVLAGTERDVVTGVRRLPTSGDIALLAESESPQVDVASQQSVSLPEAGVDSLLARFGAAGDVAFAVSAVRGDGPCSGSSLVVLPDDGIVLAGTHTDGAVFGANGPTLDAAGPVDGFLAWYDDAGTAERAHRFRSTAAETDLVVSRGSDGLFLISGDRGAAALTLTTDRESLTLPPPANGGSDFLARLHPDGEFGRAADLTRRVASPAVIERGRIRLRIDGMTAVLEGFDDQQTTAAFETLLAEHPLVSLLVVQRANGPDFGDDHLTAARLIAEAGIETHIPFNGSMYGGGIDLFLGGRRRTVQDGATVGVRSWIDESRFSGFEIRENRNDPAHTQWLDFYAALGIPSDYYWFYLQTPRSTFRALNRDELEQFGIVTD